MTKRMSRSNYIDQYNYEAEQVLENEKLPQSTDMLEYAVNDNITPKMKKVFDFFGDEEEFADLIKRTSVHFSEEESADFMDKVIAANITEISKSGSIYKQLQALGDDYRILGKNCKSKGKKIDLPISKEDFEYNVKDMYVYFDPNDWKNEDALQMFSSYEDFNEALALINLAGDINAIYVRTPMTCHNHKRRGCCPICAGKIPEGTENIGAFSTLMVTEVATQSALQSMNDGLKINVNELLGRAAKGVKTLDEYYAWADEILELLKGDMVERRWYELALLGRLFISKNNKIKVSSIRMPLSKNHFGNFLYKPKESTFRQLVDNKTLNDSSLKTQIALNSYRKGAF